MKTIVKGIIIGIIILAGIFFAFKFDMFSGIFKKRILR